MFGTEVKHVKDVLGLGLNEGKATAWFSGLNSFELLWLQTLSSVRLFLSARLNRLFTLLRGTE